MGQENASRIGLCRTSFQSTSIVECFQNQASKSHVIAWKRSYSQSHSIRYMRSIMLAWLIKLCSHYMTSQIGLYCIRVLILDALNVRSPLTSCCDMWPIRWPCKKWHISWTRGFHEFFIEQRKAPWPSFSLRMRMYELKSQGAKSVEIQELDNLHSIFKAFHGYDLRRVRI